MERTTRHARRGLLLAAWGAFAIPERAVAQEVVWQRIGAGAKDGVGKGVHRIPDWNGDGLDDLVVSAPGDDARFADAGEWTIHDARDGAELKTLRGLAAGEKVAFAFPFDDVDGDGQVDFVEQLGSDLSYRLRSEASGAALWGSRRIYNRVPVAIDDLDGDGIREIATGSTGSGSAGYPIHLFSGRTALVVRQIQAPSQASKKFATTLTAVPDQDGDGRVDLVVGDPARGAGSKAGWVGLYSTGSGALLAQVAGAASDELGAEVRLHGDVDGDGVAELLVFAAGDKSASGGGTGVVRFWSVAGLAEVDRLEPPDGTQWLSSRSIGDVDGDGCADLALSTWNYGIDWIWSTGAKRKLRGLFAQDMEVSAIASVPDLDGDGDEEIAWGDAFAPDHWFPHGDDWEEGLARVERSGPVYLTVLPKVPTRRRDADPTKLASLPPGPSRSGNLPGYFHTAYVAGFAPGALVTLELVSFNGMPSAIPVASAIAGTDGSAEIEFAHGFDDRDYVEYQAHGLGPGGAVIATGHDWCGAMW